MPSSPRNATRLHYFQTESAILPGMPGKRPTKLRIALVGAGNLATALAPSLRNAGYGIDQIVSRDRSGSWRRARSLASKSDAVAVVASRAHIQADVVWFCVPDAEISGAAASLRDAADWKGKVAIHSSGALTSDELAELRRRGAAVASVHPLMTFVKRSSLRGMPSLAGVPFAIEGDRAATRAALQIVAHLRGNPFLIQKKDKPLYHAWGMFLSPLLTALLAASERVAAAAKVARSVARKRMLPIVQQTIANYAAAGASKAFSGPIARGDAETVGKHLQVLKGVAEASEIYIALAKAALLYLPAKNRRELERILKADAARRLNTNAKHYREEKI